MSRSTVPPRRSLSRPPAPRPSRFFRPRLTAVVALVLLPLVSVSAQGPHAPPRGVIAAEGGRFVDPTDGSTFRVAGANCYYLAYSSGADEGSYEHAWVEEVLDEASSLGLNVLRLWAFQDQWWEGERALQPAPGTYNERFLVALDGLIARAAARGIRLLLCLTNYWEDYGGAIAYVKWAHAAGERAPDGGHLHRREDFFTSDLCRSWFKRFISHLLSRVNTVTGAAYRDDPAIFAWELVNEPRYQGDDTGDVLQRWIEEMAAHVKSIDANHMLTVGAEGFYGAASPSRAGDNPISGAARMGSDFARNFAASDVDFACVHVWADLWLYCDEECKLRFLDGWITGHLEEARDTFAKPVLLEEFGKWKPLGTRDAFFRRAFQLSLPPRTPVPSHAGGVLFWHMDPTDYPHDVDGFSVQVPGEIGTAEIVAAAADAARRDRAGRGDDRDDRGGRRDRRAQPPVPTSTPPTTYRSPSSSPSPAPRTFEGDAVPRYRFSTPGATSARRATAYGGAGRPPPPGARPVGEGPRLVAASARSSNPAVVNATYGDTLTVFAEFDEPIRDPPVVQIAGVCGAVEMRPVDDGGPGDGDGAGSDAGGEETGGEETSDGDGNSGAGAGTTSVPRTRFSASVTLRRPMCDVAKDGALNLTISGYTALSDGAPGPAVTPVTAVSGVERGSSVSFVDDD